MKKNIEFTVKKFSKKGEIRKEKKGKKSECITFWLQCVVDNW